MKIFEIKGGSQEMAAMMLMVIHSTNYATVILALKSLQPPFFITFHPGFLRPYHFFHSLTVFE